MAVKSWSVGDVLTAADMNAWTVPLAVIKPSAQTVTNSTAVVNDSTLVLPVAINVFYLVMAVIEYTAPTASNGGAGDLKWTFTIPAGASGFYGASYTATSGNYAGGAASAWTDTNTAQGNGVGNSMNVRITGILNMGGTAGNLQFKFAQATGNATSTSVSGNSALYAQQIG